MGEIDLLCEHPESGTLVIVEVKARQRSAGDTRQIDPEANLTTAKKTKLRTLTRSLMKQERYAGKPVRIDVIAVVFEAGTRKPVELRHYESAL